jgi:hypothetical protein
MNKINLKSEWFVAFCLISLILVSRLTAHVWNFTVVGGVALFAGAYFSKKSISVFTVFAGLFFSDLVIGMHDQMIPVYFSYALIVALGSVLEINSSRSKTAGFSVLGAVLFFLITNAAVWFGSSFYVQDLNGLFESYAMGVPFFRAQLLSDLVSSLVIFECARQLSKLRQPKVLSN